MAAALAAQEASRRQRRIVPIDSEPTIATAAARVDVDRPEIRRYLMSRGIDPDDLLEIRERIVQDGATVAVLSDRRARCAVLVDA
jgi:hypothetical protein